MKRLLLAIVFLGVGAYLVGAYVILHRSTLQELAACSSGEGGFRIPAVVCDQYARNVRGDPEDIKQFETATGIGGLFDLPENKRREWLAFVLDRGAGVNEASPIDGLTPLHAAILRNDAHLVRFLLQHGADPSLPDRQHHMTAREFAAELQRRSPDPLRGDILEALSKKG